MTSSVMGHSLVHSLIHSLDPHCLPRILAPLRSFVFSHLTQFRPTCAACICLFSVFSQFSFCLPSFQFPPYLHRRSLFIFLFLPLVLLSFFFSSQTLIIFEISFLFQFPESLPVSIYFFLLFFSSASALSLYLSYFPIFVKLPYVPFSFYPFLLLTLLVLSFTFAFSSSLLFVFPPPPFISSSPCPSLSSSILFFIFLLFSSSHSFSFLP